MPTYHTSTFCLHADIFDMFCYNSIHNSACTVLDESGELVSDPGCMSSAILPTPTPTIDSKDPDSSSDGLVTGVATSVGALVVVIMWL